MTQDARQTLEEFSLINGGDCFSHFHSEDRRPTQDFLHGLQSVARINYPATSFDVSLHDDYHLVDTTAGAVTATLPLALGNRLITFVRLTGANNITLAVSGVDTVNGGVSLVISSSYSPVRLLAIKGVGYVQV